MMIVDNDDNDDDDDDDDDDDIENLYFRIEWQYTTKKYNTEKETSKPNYGINLTNIH